MAAANVRVCSDIGPVMIRADGCDIRSHAEFRVLAPRWGQRPRDSYHCGLEVRKALWSLRNVLTARSVAVSLHWGRGTAEVAFVPAFGPWGSRGPLVILAHTLLAPLPDMAALEARGARGHQGVVPGCQAMGRLVGARQALCSGSDPLITLAVVQ